MSYLWYLLGYDTEVEEKDLMKDGQKHLKFLCCKNIERGNVPKLRSNLSREILQQKLKSKRTKVTSKVQ